MQTLVGSFCYQWVLGTWLVGLDSGVGLTGIWMCSEVLPGSFSSLYVFISCLISLPGPCSPMAEAYKMAAKNYIAL